MCRIVENLNSTLVWRQKMVITNYHSSDIDHPLASVARGPSIFTTSIGEKHAVHVQ